MTFLGSNNFNKTNSCLSSNKPIEEHKVIGLLIVLPTWYISDGHYLKSNVQIKTIYLGSG
jgi:tRNA U34 2-thiouridine synthase MnmA/TrmU